MNAARSAIGGQGMNHWHDAFFDPAAIAATTRIQTRTRWSLSASTILHAMLFTWLIVLWRPAPEVPPITEITYLEPGDLAGPVAVKPSTSAAQVSAPGELAPGDRDEQFRRGSNPSELRFESQSPGALEDRLNARLAALQGTASGPSAELPAAVYSDAAKG